MTFATLRYEVRDNVAIITNDRQERRNAWNVPMYRETVQAVEQANADDNVGAIVFTHAGPIFCAGSDFRAEPEPKDPVTGVRPNVAMLSMAMDNSWLHLLARSKPSINAISGAAIGLGVTQILPMDIRIGTPSATYAFPFLGLGFMPEVGCTALLPQLVGYGRAVDICLSSAKLDAQEALRIGLITRIVPEDKLLDEAVALGSKIAGYPRLQTQLTRDLIAANAWEDDKNALLKRETEAFVTMFKAIKAGDAATKARAKAE